MKLVERYHAIDVTGSLGGRSPPWEDMMRQLIAFAVALPVIAVIATTASAAGSGKFCLQGPGKSMNCQYQTMAACDKAKKGSESCVANPSSTTGSGMTKSSPTKKY